MSVALTTNPGGVFRRLGKVLGLVNAVNSFRGTADLSGASIVSTGVGVDNIQGQYAATRQDLINTLYGSREDYRQAHSSFLQYLQTLAANTLIQQVNDDTKLSSLDVTSALKELIRQMTASSDSVPKPTCSAAVTAGTNTGGGVAVASVLGANGVQLDYLFAETVALKCVSDSQGGGTAGQESFLVTTPTAQTDTLYYNWPLGSGVTGTLTAVDALQDIASGTLLQNGAFKTFSNSNAPDNWPKDTGTFGSTILQATGGSVYQGSSGLAFVGNGSELTSISQPFATSPSATLGAGGTSSVLSPSTVYAVNLFVKMSATPAAGVLEVALTDGAGTITTDAASTQNKVQKALTAVSTSWVAVNGFFRTPAVNPSTGYKLRVRLSTALESAKTAYIGHLAMTPATQLYTGGPFLSVFSGNPYFILNDSFSVAVANNYGSAWQKGFERLFSMRALGLQLPSSGSPTVADNLIG